MTFIVLVHGAWHGSTSWGRMLDVWPDGEPAALALDLPSTSGVGDLHTDAEAVIEFANLLEGDIILVGHSYGGAVCTQAAARIPRLRGVIYLAAFRPEVGSSVSQAAALAPHRSDLDASINFVPGEGLVLADNAAEALYGSTDLDVVAEQMSALHPQPLETFRQEVTADVPDGVPTHYIVCTQDRAVTPELQEIMAKRCSTRSILEACHEPQIEFPQATAAEIRSIAAAW
jgi:pimeloyl-ACP methyl ester carboxylesterase